MAQSPTIPSQQPLPRQLDLPSRLAGLEPALRHANARALTQLELVLVTRPGAGAVVREMDAGKRVWAEVVGAIGCFSLTLVVSSYFQP